MDKKGTALIALAGFGLGMFVGKGIAAYDSDHAADATALRHGDGHVAGQPPAPGRTRPRRRGRDDAADGRCSQWPRDLCPAHRPARARLTCCREQTNLRRQRKFKEAAATYRLAAKSGAMNADAWADYADALASAGSSLQGAPADALEKALALDPRHPKALWLKASLEHEEHRYRTPSPRGATCWPWCRCNSSDARIIEANIAEATRLAASQG